MSLTKERLIDLLTFSTCRLQPSPSHLDLSLFRLLPASSSSAPPHIIIIFCLPPQNTTHSHHQPTDRPNSRESNVFTTFILSFSPSISLFPLCCCLFPGCVPSQLSQPLLVPHRVNRSLRAFGLRRQLTSLSLSFRVLSLHLLILGWNNKEGLSLTLSNLSFFSYLRLQFLSRP
ncbi:hypothetical protein LY78DRAFT_420238 [Colletotrichum sublineola]|nr:hypothetical protein LY78DRAFT_420238 [Colletotrichum sublineola]